ncbi:hypothetical protein ABZ929_28760 [Streptomyces physcomitrii]|uniref:hypothetical protein n=1 Tax=Streptomyces physcomitrii TaxID=2724184 RepID=UPI003435EB68
MIKRHQWILAVGLLFASTLVAHPAHADVSPGGGNQGGGETQTENKRESQTLSSRITFKGATAGPGGKSGIITPVGNWTPPACWYEPYSADEFAKDTERGFHMVADDPRQPNYAKRSVGEFRDIYKDGKYKNYNKGKGDEGSWWVAKRDPDRWLEDAAQKCDRQPFWVENGDPVDDPHAVSPEILAQLAYNKIKLPDTKVTLAPAGASKVNLPAWAWLDKAKFKKVSVSAALNAQGVNIQATTTARPVALKLEPGTGEARTFPGSGICRIKGDGSIGEPYAKGKAEQDPPCGVAYLRKGSYDLTATVTWEVSWEGTGEPGPNKLPDGSFGNEQQVVVEEVQSVNR